MPTTTLRPILRTPFSSSVNTHIYSHRPTIVSRSPTCTRSATEIRRPRRPWVFDQVVVLSDGSSYKQLTTSPQGVVRSNKDVRNHALWNPSLQRLLSVEEDEAGRLKRFRDKFGVGFDSANTIKSVGDDGDVGKSGESGEAADNLVDMYSKGHEILERERTEKIEAARRLKPVIEKKVEAAPAKKGKKGK